jgi:hypothetical protein
LLLAASFWLLANAKTLFTAMDAKGAKEDQTQTQGLTAEIAEKRRGGAEKNLIGSIGQTRSKPFFPLIFADGR